MSPYRKAYEASTGLIAPKEAEQLDDLFQRIVRGDRLPPRGQQAVDAGLTAHSLNDRRENPQLFDYYQWVLANVLTDCPVNELSAKLIGMAFTCMSIFKTDLPQPLTLNPWQIAAMQDYPLGTKQAVVIENNGVFVWLATLHPEWPLINQAGNDLNSAYIQLMQSLELRGVQLTYLGDLDSRGIQMADSLFRQLSQTSIETFTAIQSPANVSYWLTLKGKKDVKRTRRLEVKTPVLCEELDSIRLFGKFVEQEQLISNYERLIEEWLIK